MIAGVARLVAWWPLLAGVVGGAAALYAAWWLWWRLPKRQARRLNLPDDKTHADVEDNFRKTISQVFGGAAVLAGAAFAYVQFMDQHRTSRQQLQASHDLLISQQVSKGFEQLGSEKAAVRLGGVYALEGVMNTSEQYQTAVLEALCAFVRDQTKKETSDPPIIEVQAALTVIGRRELAQDLNDLSLLEYFAGQVPVDLHAAHIPFASLTHAKLSTATLIGAELNGAVLVNADLSHANLTNAALIAAYMIGANLNKAVLTGTDLRGARLDGANLAAVLIGTDLRGKPCGRSRVLSAL